MKSRLRWAIPSLVFVMAAFPLVFLAFENDEQMASIFHPMADYWALSVHAMMILIPMTAAFLPEGAGAFSERNIARGAWIAAIFVAMIGNASGGIAHASGRSIAQVLDGAPTTASDLRQFVGAAGGFLVVLLELALGWLAESNLRRFLFGSPTDEAAATSEAGNHALDNPQPQPQLTGRQPAQLPRVRVDRLTVDKRRRKQSKLTRKQPEPVAALSTSTTGASTTVVGPVNQVDDNPEPTTVVVGEPAELTDELIHAVGAYRRYGNLREAGRYLSISCEAVRKRLARAREIAPEWVADQIGE